MFLFVKAYMKDCCLCLFLFIYFYFLAKLVNVKIEIAKLVALNRVSDLKDV